MLSIMEEMGQMVLLGLTQQVVARRAGIGEIYLSKVERGHRPLTPALERRIRAAIDIEAVERAEHS